MSVLFFKQKAAYEITYGDWSSDVCSSDLHIDVERGNDQLREGRDQAAGLERDRIEKIAEAVDRADHALDRNRDLQRAAAAIRASGVETGAGVDDEERVVGVGWRKGRAAGVRGVGSEAKGREGLRAVAAENGRRDPQREDKGNQGQREPMSSHEIS